MTCNEFENRFLAGQEDAMSANERAAGEQHFAACSACQTLARQLQELDTALTRTVRVPVFPARFNQRLAERIQAATTVLPEAQRLERKRQLQAEYETGLEELQRSFLRLTGSQEGLGYVALAALMGGLAWQFTPRLIAFLAARGLTGANQTLLLAAAAGALFLAMGLTVALRQTPRQHWSLR